MIVRRDVFEVIYPDSEETIKFNQYKTSGFKVVKAESKEELLEKAIEKLDNLSLENLKDFLKD